MSGFNPTIQEYNAQEMSNGASHDFKALPNANTSSICKPGGANKENAPLLQGKIEGVRASPTISANFGLTVSGDPNLTQENGGKRSFGDEKFGNIWSQNEFQGPVAQIQLNPRAINEKKDGQLLDEIEETKKEKYKEALNNSSVKPISNKLSSEGDGLNENAWRLNANQQNENVFYPYKQQSSCCKYFSEKETNGSKLEDKRLSNDQEESEEEESQKVKGQPSILSITEPSSLAPINKANTNFKVNFELREKYNLWDGELVLVERLGKGSFGEVHRVFAKASRVFYAQKKLLKKRGQFDDVGAKREYQALLILLSSKKRELLQVIQLDYQPKVEFYALMEYGEGTLEDFSDFLIKKNYHWEDKDLLNLYYQLYDQLGALSNLSLCHRDIKPANIIISNEESFKLTDYGLAEILKVKGLQKMTRAGTRRYWAPEIDQAYMQGLHECLVDPFQADLFSINQTLDTIIMKDGRCDRISDLLNKYPDYYTIFQTGNKKIELYEKHKKEYRMYHFEKLYQHLSMSEKYKIMHIFLEYYNFNEVHKWLNTKLKDHIYLSQEELQLVYFLKAEIYQLTGNYEKARRAFLKSEQVHLQSGKGEDEFIARLYSAKGTIEAETSSFDQAEQYYFKSLDLKKKIFGKHHIEVAKELYAIGLVQALRTDSTKALSYYQEAIKIYEFNNAGDSLDALRLDFELGMSKGGLGEYDEGLKILKKDIEKIKRSRGDTHPYMVVALNNNGLIYGYCGKTKKALHSYFQALEISNKCFKMEHPKNVAVWSGIANTYYFTNQKENALACLKICVRLLNKNNDKVESVDLLDLFGKSPYIFCFLYTIAEICLDMGDYAKAKEYLLLCVKGYEMVSPDNYERLRIHWVKWNYLFQKKMSKQVLENFQKKTKTVKSLTDQLPELVLIKQKLGLIYLQEKKYAEADNVLKETMTRNSEVQESEQGSLVYKMVKRMH